MDVQADEAAQQLFLVSLLDRFLDEPDGELSLQQEHVSHCGGQFRRAVRGQRQVAWLRPVYSLLLRESFGFQRFLFLRVGDCRQGVLGVDVDYVAVGVVVDADGRRRRFVRDEFPLAVLLH